MLRACRSTGQHWVGGVPVLAKFLQHKTKHWQHWVHWDYSRRSSSLRGQTQASPVP
jgi:hypothetical protein